MIELVPAEPAALASPCVNICALDDATGWCVGCGRTLAEIGDWSSKPATERRAILLALPPRMAQLASRA